MKRMLRISAFNDYLAVDMVDEKNNIASTPIYLRRGESAIVKNLNREQKIWCRTQITFDAKKQIVRCEGIDDSAYNSDFGLSFDVTFDDLIDEKQFKY